MKKIISLSLLLLSIIYLGSAQEKESVKLAFEAYKSAIINDNVDVAIKSVDSKTVKYFTDILDKTKNADEAMVNSLGILDKFTVLTIRHRVSKNDILTFDADDVLRFAIEQGMIGKSSIKSLSIGEITVEGDFAQGQLITDGQATPVSFHFYKEDNSWKIDLTSILPVGAFMFSQVVAESGLEENVFLFNILESMNGKVPSKDIWMPISN